MKRLFSFYLVVLLGLAFVGSVTPSWSAGTLKVTSPNGGQKLTTGKKYAITWAKGNAGKYVRIQLLRSGKVYKWITKKTKNDGRFTWKVPTNTKAGSKYRVRVQSLTKPKLHDVSDLFLVTGKGKKTNAAKAAITTLKVKSPNGDELLIKGKVVVIKWTKGNGGKFIKILLLKSNKPYKWVSKKTRNDGKHPWKVPKGLAISSEYKIKLIALKNKKVIDVSDGTFSIDTEADDNKDNSVDDGTWIDAPDSFDDDGNSDDGDSKVTNPSKGERWRAGSNYTIMWEVDGSTFSYTNIFLKKGTKPGTLIQRIADRSDWGAGGECEWTPECNFQRWDRSDWDLINGDDYYIEIEDVYNTSKQILSDFFTLYGC
jgi:hypothetical protein